jgi:hypothetical protein
MTEARGKSPRDQYQEAIELIDKKKDRLNSLSDKAQKTRDKLTQEISDLEIKLKELEPIKDQIVLSQTTKSALESIFWEREFNIKKEIVSNPLEKGIVCEPESIELAVRVLFPELEGTPGSELKNEEHYSNDFVQGTPDLIIGDAVIDIKTSFTAHSFPLTAEEPSSDYYYQVQTYLALTGKSVGYVVHCLVDTPENLIQDELYRYARKNGLIDCPEDVESDIREAHLYSRLPDKLRIKSFVFERDDKTIEKIYKRVEECREYYESELLTKIF